MSESGSVTDTYTYDAFGNLLKSTGRTANNYRYCGEQFDSTTGLYYLRARYMDTNTGRFISQDSYAGSVYDPVSLHKYLYANSNPVMYSDPSGYMSLAGAVTASAIVDTMFYSASTALISLGMNLIRQLKDVEKGIRKSIEWSEIIKETLISTFITLGLCGIGLFIVPLIPNILAKAVVCYVLSGTCFAFGGLELYATYCDIKSGDYDLAFVDFLLALCSFYGAKKGFDQANALMAKYIPAKNISDLPPNVQQSYNDYQKAGWKNHKGQTPKTAVGGGYDNNPTKNSGTTLPTKDPNGNPITYKEFDVNNYTPQGGRGVERFVVGDDGSVYYTDSHYGDKTSLNGIPDFVKIK